MIQLAHHPDIPAAAAAAVLRRIEEHPSPANDAATRSAFTAAGYADVQPRENVLTFAHWLIAGRVVMKGERAVKVEMMIPAELDDNDEPRRFIRRTVNLFHINQTHTLDPEKPLSPKLKSAVSSALNGHANRRSSTSRRSSRRGPNRPPATPRREPTPTPRPTPQPPTFTGDEATADKLDALADAMQKTIDEKRNPAIANQNPTARRIRIAEGMRRDAARLEETQTALHVLAQHHRAGTVPHELAQLKSRSAVHDAMNRYSKEPAAKALQSLVDHRELSPAEQIAKSAKAKAEELRQAEAALFGAKIPGYFPTPPAVVERIIAAADIRPGLSVLEPSAGKGDIAEAVEAAGGSVTCMEIAPQLAAILRLKGLTAHNVSCLDCSAKFDRIVMNPPFENGQDIDHIRRMFEQLNPGGRLVSVVCEGPFFRKDRKSEDFRDWLETVGAHTEKLPAGSFLASGTGVATRLVTIDK